MKKKERKSAKRSSMGDYYDLVAGIYGELNRSVERNLGREEAD